MQRALDDAATPADRAFARYYLGELAFNGGDPEAALAHFQAGIDADPSYARLLEGRARAAGRPGPGRRGRWPTTPRWSSACPNRPTCCSTASCSSRWAGRATADRQYRVFRSVASLFESQGVALDVDTVLFEADHGDAGAALQAAEVAIGHRRSSTWPTPTPGPCTSTAGTRRRWSGPTRRSQLGHPQRPVPLPRGRHPPGPGRRRRRPGHLAEALAINPHFNPLAGPRWPGRHWYEAVLRWPR